MGSDEKCSTDEVVTAAAEVDSARVGAEEDVICDGKNVVVERGDQQRIIYFKSDRTISFGKGPTQQEVLLKGALGSPFLSAFKVSPAPPEVVANFNSLPCDNDDSKRWRNNKPNKKKAQRNLFVLERSVESVAKVINEFYQLPDSISSGTDNRNIVADNKSQALKKEDIASMREQGVRSKEILETIIASSKSFSQKTEFSQEKYLKKKEKIYGEVIVFRKPSISVLADFYFKKDPAKVLGLRPDTLSQLLSYANIHANGKFLVFENCAGLVVAAVLHRLGGLGTVLHCHMGSYPQRQALVSMNFTDSDLKPMMYLDIQYLLRTGTTTDPTTSEPQVSSEKLTEETYNEPEAKKRRIEDEDNNDILVEDGTNGSDSKPEEQVDHEDNATFVRSSRLAHTNTKEDNEKSLEFFNQNEFDGLIICGKEHPLNIFQRFVKKLALSSPFVIFCQYPEPLMDCYQWVKEKGLACNVHLVDNWLRNIQVASERTHPEILMSPSGGYLLHGTYTEP